MACTVRELKEALKLLDDDDMIGVDDGGLTLVVVGDPGTFFEIGGIPLDDEDEEDEEEEEV